MQCGQDRKHKCEAKRAPIPLLVCFNRLGLLNEWYGSRGFPSTIPGGLSLLPNRWNHGMPIARDSQMKRTPSQDWSEAELRRLRGMVRRNIDAKQIAIALGRHVGSVKSKVRELGFVPRKTVR